MGNEDNKKPNSPKGRKEILNESERVIGKIIPPGDRAPQPVRNDHPPPPLKDKK